MTVFEHMIIPLTNMLRSVMRRKLAKPLTRRRLTSRAGYLVDLSCVGALTCDTGRTLSGGFLVNVRVYQQPLSLNVTY